MTPEHVEEKVEVRQAPRVPGRVTLQRKLHVGSANDPLEREADMVAARIVASGVLSSDGGQATHGEGNDRIRRATPSTPAGSDGQSCRDRIRDADVSTASPTVGVDHGVVARRVVPRITRAAAPPVSSASNSWTTTAYNGVGQSPLAGRIQPASAAPSVGLEGGAVDHETESRITRASGGGAPMDEGLRRSFETGFGADFSKVRVHTDSAADSLNRQIQARAFTTGSDIFFRGGEYRPSTRSGQHLIAHELTHVVQQGGGSSETVNRALGLEFETGWHVFHELPSKNPGTAPLEVPYKKEEAIFGGRNLPLGWSMETDGLDIEFVIEPPFAESAAGLVTLAQVMGSLLLFTNQLDAVRNLARLTPATHPQFFQTPDPQAVIRPTGDVLKAQPQATMGIRLDRMEELFREMGREGDTSDLSSREGTTFYALRAVAAATAAGNAANVNGNAASDELKGFLTLVNQYIKQGDQVGRRAYAKDIAYAMARTNFTAMFARLPEHVYFQANPQVFVPYVLANAGFAGSGTDLLIKQQIADGQDANSMSPGQQAALPRLPLTRGQWLHDISQGTDRLTQAATINTMAYTDVKGGNRLRAMGLLGNTTDNVGGNNSAGIILELRQMKRAIPATEWQRVATGLLTYLIALNDHNSTKAVAGQAQYARI